MNNDKEKAAIAAAFEQQIGQMYKVLLLDLAQDSANTEGSRQRFAKGIALARQARDLAIKIVSE